MKRAALVMVMLSFALAACDRTPLDERVFEMGLQVERERAGFDLKQVEFDGFRLTYLERPAEGETIVLLHGFASEKDAWTRFARHVPREYRVIAVDLPGHGESTRRMEEIHDIPYLVARLAQGFDAMGLERFHIAGNSLGGMAALLYAHGHPDRVLSLGLFAPAGVRPQGESEFERMLQQGENPLIVDSREEFDRLMDLVFEERPPMPWPVGEVLERRYAQRAAFHEKMWEDIWTRAEEVTELLPAITPPTLVVWGDSDRILHPSSMEVFARWLPHAEFEVMLHTGHSPMIERPSRSAELYVDFVRRSGRESAGSGAGRSGPSASASPS